MSEGYWGAPGEPVIPPELSRSAPRPTITMDVADLPAIKAAIDAAYQQGREDVRAQVLDALQLIDRHGCEHFTRGRCLDATSGKERGAQYGADAWCDPCIAADALAAMNATDPPSPSAPAHGPNTARRSPSVGAADTERETGTEA